MKALLQRVSRAAVRVEGKTVGRIGGGLLVLLGCERGDDEQAARSLASRVATYRLFPDEDGLTNYDLAAIGGEVLVVSQFTLAADTRRGRRPSFDAALPPDRAERLVSLFCEEIRQVGIPVETGRFGESMQVELLNEGPATYLLQTSRRP